MSTTRTDFVSGHEQISIHESLYYACQEGRLDVVEKLISYGTDVNVSVADLGSPIYIACQKGFVDIVHALIRGGANVNIVEKDTQATPLFVACHVGNKDVVDVLLANGADMNKPEEYRKLTPIHTASARGHQEVVDLLLNAGAVVDAVHPNKVTPLYLACQEGFYSIVEKLINRHADINLQEIKGTSPLYTASARNHYDIVQLLTVSGANVNLSTHNRINALHVASQNGHTSVVEHLISAGCKVNYAEKSGVTPLHFACQCGHVLAAKVLLSCGADINVTTELGGTPLSLACQTRQLDVINFLLANGASVMKTQKAVHLACHNGYDDIVRIMIEAGASMVSGHTDDPDTQLIHCAAKEGHAKIIELLITKGAQVNVTDQSGITPLMYACEAGSLDTVQRLIEQGAILDFQNPQHVTPLHFACQGGYSSIVAYLIKNGADINAQHLDGLSHLYTASANNQPNIVKILADSGADVNISTNDGTSALHVASQNGHAAVIEHLISAGCKVNCVQESGATPLHFACQCGQLTAANVLLRAGADVNATGGVDVTPLALACQKRQLEIMKLLLEKGASVTSAQEEVHLACHQGYEDIVRIMIEAGIPVSLKEPDDSETQLIHCAAQYGHDTIVDYLIGKGACVNATKKKGISPLMLACREGHLRAVQRLLFHGADCNQRTLQSTTPLIDASSQGNVEIVRILLQAGANSNQKTETGSTALYITSRLGSREIVESLLKSGAAVNNIENDHASALQVASEQGHLHIAQMLIEYGSDINYVCLDPDVSPLYLACSNNHADVVEYLLSAGANVNLSGDRGITPIYIASWHDSIAIVNLLLKYNADINAPYQTGTTPLFLACIEGRLKCAKVLLDAGADVDSLSLDENFSCLQAICRYIAGDIPNLIENGSLLNEPDIHTLFIAILKKSKSITAMSDHGTTALDILLQCYVTDNSHTRHIISFIKPLLSILSNKLQLGKLLYNVVPNIVRTTSKLEERWSSHTTFSALACKLFCVDIVTLLSEISDENVDHILASVNYLDQNILHILICESNELPDRTEKINFFIGKGVNIRAQDVNGRTPLHLASMYTDVSTTAALCLRYTSEDLSIKDNLSKTHTYYIEKLTHGRHIQLPVSVIEIPFQPLESVSTLQSPRLKISPTSDDCVTTSLLYDGFGEVQMSGENLTIYKTIKMFVSLLCELIGNADPVMKCKPVLSGSVSEGCKTGFLDEFDFIFSLEKFESMFEVYIKSTDDELHAVLSEPTIMMPEFAKYWRSGSKLSSVMFTDTAFSADIWHLVMKSVSNQKMRDFLKNSNITIDDIRRKSGFVGTIHITWYGATYPKLPICIDVVPGFGHGDYWCLLRPRHSDGEMIGSQYTTGMELSTQKLDSSLLLSLSKDIRDGYCLSKIIRSLGHDFKTDDSLVLKVDDLIPSYLLKMMLFWIIDPENKWKDVYPSLDNNAFFGEEPHEAVVAETIRLCDELLQQMSTRTHEEILSWDSIVEEIEYVKDICINNPKELSTQDVTSPYKLAALSNINRRGDQSLSHCVHNVKNARMWAMRIFRMLKRILTNNLKVHIYYLPHMHIKIKDVQLILALCQIFIHVLQPF